MRQLGRLLAHAAETVPFYCDRLPVRPGTGGAGPAIDDFRAIPLLGRSDITGAGDAFVTRRLPKGHGPTSTTTTSGSTGRPVTVQTTAVTDLFFSALNLRYHMWHRPDLTAKVASVRVLGDDLAKAAKENESGQWAAAHVTGSMVFLDIYTPVNEQLAWLHQQNPDHLLTYPSNLRALLQRSAETGVRIDHLQSIATMGEMLPSDLRTVCDDVWGIPISDAYSSREVGMIAVQCPDHPHYHVQGENLLVEVLDGAGEPCPPGSVGRLVITDLHNFATPIIRYDIGDYAEVGESCPCSRGLPVITRILGRVRNLLTLPNGDQFWPDLTTSKFKDVVPVLQWQVVQKTLRHLEMRVVAGRDLTTGEEEHVRQSMLSDLGYPFDITFVYTDEIRRGPGGKYEDFRSEVSA